MADWTLEEIATRIVYDTNCVGQDAGKRKLAIVMTWLETVQRQANLQVGDAMRACPWATHATEHHEPKHCIASLSALIELRQIEKRNPDLGLDFPTYEAAKKEQADGKRIPIEDAIKGLPDKRKDVCGSTKPGATGVGYGYPLTCGLDKGHPMPHRSGVLAVEWD